MKNVVYNKDNISDKEVTDLVVRAKGILISNGYLLLGNEDGTLQFPGGHLEENKTLEECLLRELQEETGIKLKDIKLKSFMKITYYNKNYHNSGNNRKNDIYYYVIRTVEKVNLNNINLTDGDIDGNFTVRMIPLDNVKQVLIDSIKDNPINEVIVKEMNA